MSTLACLDNALSPMPTQETTKGGQETEGLEGRGGEEGG